MRGEPFIYPGAVRALVHDYLSRVRTGDALPEDPLSSRELEVVKLIAEGYTGREIAAELVLSEKTVERHRDVLLVAGVRMSTRKQLRAAGTTTIDQLAALTEPPKGMPRTSFDKLVAQARLQVAHLDGGPVTSELVDGGRALATLPAPSPGDVFFDFEGDPLHREADPRVWGLEYLWGVVYRDGATPTAYRDWWAHDEREERLAFEGFIDWLMERRRQDPSLHVYHYAA